MIRKRLYILTVILMVSVLVLSASCGAPASEETTEPAPTTPSSAWRLQQPLYIITGHSTPLGSREFWERAWQLLGGRSSLFGGYPQFRGIEKYIESIKRSNSILIIDASSVADLEALEDFGSKYPELLPLSYEELRSYPLPLIYFARDWQTKMVRGIIITDEVPSSLADSLAEKGVPLELPVRHEEGKFNPIEKREETTAPSLPTVSSVWRLQSPLWFVTGQSARSSWEEFNETVQEVLGGSASLVGGYPLVTGVERHLESIRSSNSILFISASSATDLESLEELSDKYPELLPLSYDELRHYTFPLIYFAQDWQTNMVRGLIIVDEVVGSLADLLMENGVPLGVPLRYEDGQLNPIES